MAASKQFLANYLLKSPASGENHHLVGSSLEVVMDKSTLLCPKIADCDSYRPDKVNSSIHSPNTRAICQSIKKSLSSAIHGVAHTTSILEIDCLAYEWHIARLPPNSAKQCWALQGIIETVCNAKVGIGKHGTLASTYKGLWKECRFPNNGEYEFWFCPDDIKRCVNGNIKIYICWIGL